MAKNKHLKHGMMVLTITAIATAAYFTLFDIKKIETKATETGNTEISAVNPQVSGNTITFDGTIPNPMNPSAFQILANNLSYEGKDIIITSYFMKNFVISGTHNFNSLTIINSSVNTSNLEKMEIHAVDITLNNSTINVSGQGQPGGIVGKAGQFYNCPSNLPGNGSGMGGGFAATSCSPSDNGGGGTYGGIGGKNGGSQFNTNTYGDPNNPSDFGSGGGGGANCNTSVDQYAGSGGGVIRLFATGELNIVSGDIIANGQDAWQTGLNGSGGGSGGSIYIEAKNIRMNPGTVYFYAKGGIGGLSNGSCANVAYNGSGGGGGRIAIKTQNFIDASGNNINNVLPSQIMDVTGAPNYDGSLGGSSGGAGSQDGSNLIIIQTEIPTSTCGNGVCDPGENSTTCPSDCPVAPPSIVNNDYGLTGVLVYLSAQGPSSTVGDASASTTTTPINTNAITYTLKVSNMSSIEKIVKLKFSLPPGFAFNSMVSGAPNPDGITGSHINTTTNYETLYWSNYTAKPGEYDVVFKVTPPVVP
ncbi:MAG TPA: hypothetical protein P5096_03800 [Patescibacteria group bacterium]|nr:hypothetical protein [Patescibacteria group bacterium]